MQASVAASLMSPTARGSAPSASQMPETVWRITAMLSGTAGTTSVDVGWPVRHCGAAAQRRLGFGARGVDREDVVQARQLEDPADRRMGVVSEHEAERHVALARAAQAADEDAEDRRVDERRLVQVDDHGAALAQIVQAGSQLGCGGEVVLTGHREHRALAVDSRSSVDASAARQRSAPLQGVSSGLQRISDETYLQVGAILKPPTLSGASPSVRSGAVGAAPRILQRALRRASAGASLAAVRSSSSSRARSTRFPAASLTLPAASLTSPLAWSSLPSASRLLSPRQLALELLGLAGSLSLRPIWVPPHRGSSCPRMPAARQAKPLSRRRRGCCARRRARQLAWPRAGRGRRSRARARWRALARPCRRVPRHRAPRGRQWRAPRAARSIESSTSPTAAPLRAPSTMPFQVLRIVVLQSRGGPHGWRLARLRESRSSADRTQERTPPRPRRRRRRRPLGVVLAVRILVVLIPGSWLTSFLGGARLATGRETSRRAV